MYSLPASSSKKQSFREGARRAVTSGNWNHRVTNDLSEQDIWDTTLKVRLGKEPENIKEIAEYGFTEMVNNVKDNSQASGLSVSYKIVDNVLHIGVYDNGIGIFKKLKDGLALPTLRESILHLSKGKLTTDHAKHSGEGIFFSSRVFDEYFMLANGLIYGRINDMPDEDWFIGEEKRSN